MRPAARPPPNHAQPHDVGCPPGPVSTHHTAGEGLLRSAGVGQRVGQVPEGPLMDGPLRARRGTGGWRIGPIIMVAGQKVRVGRIHARKVVHVHIEETTLTVYDGQAAMMVVPRQSTTNVNRFRAKHQIRPGRTT
jgi:hypothetical protein